MARFDLKPLYDARRGLPSEPKAVRVIATFAAIPLAIVGIGIGVLVVPETDTSLRLLWVGGGAAFGVAGLGIAGIMGIRRIFPYWNREKVAKSSGISLDATKYPGEYAEKFPGQYAG